MITNESSHSFQNSALERMDPSKLFDIPRQNIMLKAREVPPWGRIISATSPLSSVSHAIGLFSVLRSTPLFDLAQHNAILLTLYRYVGGFHHHEAEGKKVSSILQRGVQARNIHGQPGS